MAVMQQREAAWKLWLPLIVGGILVLPFAVFMFGGLIATAVWAVLSAFGV